MNTDELVKAVRHSGLISDYDSEWTDEQILIEADQVLIETFAEALSKLRAGHWKKYKIVPLVQGQDFYQLPPRALAQSLQAVEISSNGKDWDHITVLTDSQATDIGGTEMGSPRAYVCESDGLRLIPRPGVDGHLRMTYLLRPPKLVSLEELSPIITVIEVTPTSVLVQVPEGSGLDAFRTPGHTDYDRGQFIGDFQRTSGSHEMSMVDAELKSQEQHPTITDEYYFTFYNDHTRVLPGDLMVPLDQAPYPVLPAELHRALADATASAIWRSRGDYEKADRLAQRADIAIKRVVNMSTPRVKNAPFIWWNKNSYLRRNIGGW